MAASPQVLIDSGASIGLPSNKHEPPVLIHRTRPALGTLFEVCLIGGEYEQLSAVAETCLAEVQRLDRRLSRFHSQSEVARINREAPRGAVIVDYELAELLTLCRCVAQQTDGWFDIAAGQAWSIKNRGVEFLEPGMQIDFSGISRGYALDRSAELLDEFSIADAVLHAGTHAVRAQGNSPSGRGWQVRVRNPANDSQGSELLVDLCDEALAVLTSAELKQPAEQRAAVAVVARTAFEAESLASVFLAMGRERTMEFLNDRLMARVAVAWLDDASFPHEAHWHWLTGERE
jgi:thiamine biosynthesis lipoprotein